jgi:predicted RecB family nuclease
LIFTALPPQPIIPRMIRWTLQSNACDVLGLGPRAAGRLATVGVRTVAELLAVKPQSAADKQFSAETIASWQREARLRVSVPDLPNDAARILAAIEIASAERLARSTPTELIAGIEALWRDQQRHSWLAMIARPTTAEICGWIGCAQHDARATAA